MFLELWRNKYFPKQLQGIFLYGCICQVGMRYSTIYNFELIRGYEFYSLVEDMMELQVKQLYGIYFAKQLNT